MAQNQTPGAHFPAESGTQQLLLSLTPSGGIAPWWTPIGGEIKSVWQHSWVYNAARGWSGSFAQFQVSSRCLLMMALPGMPAHSQHRVKYLCAHLLVTVIAVFLLWKWRSNIEDILVLDPEPWNTYINICKELQPLYCTFISYLKYFWGEYRVSRKFFKCCRNLEKFADNAV